MADPSPLITWKKFDPSELSYSLSTSNPKNKNDLSSFSFGQASKKRAVKRHIQVSQVVTLFRTDRIDMTRFFLKERRF